MSEEFTINPELGAALRRFLYSQFFCTPSYPTLSFANQTIIVTGSNVGLGFEAARHFYRLNCAKLILGVRNISKGEAAKEDIVHSVRNRKDADAIEVWPLDLSSTESTLAFAERIKTNLPRLDAIVQNAGIHHELWEVSEGWEQTIQVNVINTLLLGLLALPKLRDTKKNFTDSSPHLEIVSSQLHRFTTFREANAPNIYERLNDERFFDGKVRYNISKLLEILFTREFVSRLQAQNASVPHVTITTVNPGLCVSSLYRNHDQSLVSHVFGLLLRWVVGRSTEVGARTLVYGVCAGPQSHGQYMADGQNQDVEEWLYSDMGKRVQKKVFEQTMDVLEERSPGLREDLML